MSISRSEIKIASYKHGGEIHRVWYNNMILKQTDQMIIAINDGTKVTESDGSIWRTNLPAIVCFYRDFWFNIIAIMKSEGIEYYCNLSSPYEIDEEMIRYIDYDLDVVVTPDKSIQLLDEDEYAFHKQKYNYPKELDSILQKHMSYLYDWIHNDKEPFTMEFVNYWYDQYLQRG